MIFGDRHPYLVAVVVPDPEFVAAYVDGEVPADLSALAADPDFAKSIGAAVNRVNMTLMPSERVRRFVVATEAFTIANGQMTPTLKIKRHVIRERYGAALDALYRSKEIAA
jgi:long-chain acyl-CoA synthetase